MHHWVLWGSKEWLSSQEHAKCSHSVQADTYLKVLNETTANSQRAKLTACHSNCLSQIWLYFFFISNHKCMQSITLNRTPSSSFKQATFGRVGRVSGETSKLFPLSFFKYLGEAQLFHKKFFHFLVCMHLFPKLHLL